MTILDQYVRPRKNIFIAEMWATWGMFNTHLNNVIFLKLSYFSFDKPTLEHPQRSLGWKERVEKVWSLFSMLNTVFIFFQVKWIMVYICNSFVQSLKSSCQVQAVSMCLSATAECFLFFRWKYTAHSLPLCETASMNRHLDSLNSHQAKEAWNLFQHVCRKEQKIKKIIVKIHIRNRAMQSMTNREADRKKK